MNVDSREIIQYFYETLLNGIVLFKTNFSTNMRGQDYTENIINPIMQIYYRTDLAFTGKRVDNSKLGKLLDDMENWIADAEQEPVPDYDLIERGISLFLKYRPYLAKRNLIPLPPNLKITEIDEDATESE